MSELLAIETFPSSARGGQALNYCTEFIVISTFVRKGSETTFGALMNFREEDAEDADNIVPSESRENLFMFRTVPTGLRLKCHKDDGQSTDVNQCQKPIRLLRFIIEHYSFQDNVVLDLCSGSQSTAVACILSNRHCVSIENDEFQFSQGRGRIAQALESIAECRDEESGFTLIANREF